MTIKTVSNQELKQDTIILDLTSTDQNQETEYYLKHFIEEYLKKDPESEPLSVLEYNQVYCFNIEGKETYVRFGKTLKIEPSLKKKNKYNILLINDGDAKEKGGYGIGSFHHDQKWVYKQSILPFKKNKFKLKEHKRLDFEKLLTTSSVSLVDDNLEKIAEKELAYCIQVGLAKPKTVLSKRLINGKICYSFSLYRAGEQTLAKVIDDPHLTDKDKFNQCFSLLEAYLSQVWMHQLGHYDLKPGNVMITDKRACIIDHGFSLYHHEDFHDEWKEATFPYSPPVDFETAPKSRFSWDLFSLGVIMAELLIGENFKVIKERYYEERPRQVSKVYDWLKQDGLKQINANPNLPEPLIKLISQLLDSPTLSYAEQKELFDNLPELIDKCRFECLEGKQKKETTEEHYFFDRAYQRLKTTIREISNPSIGLKRNNLEQNNPPFSSTNKVKTHREHYPGQMAIAKQTASFAKHMKNKTSPNREDRYVLYALNKCLIKPDNQNQNEVSTSIQKASSHWPLVLSASASSLCGLIALSASIPIALFVGPIGIPLAITTALIGVGLVGNAGLTAKKAGRIANPLFKVASSVKNTLFSGEKGRANRNEIEPIPPELS